MKIKQITREITEKNELVFNVALIPNRIEKLFGVKEKLVTYKDSGSNYWSGGGTIYFRKNGTQTSNGHWIAEAIDRWRNAF